MGFIEDVTTWFWNMFVYFNVAGGAMGCWMVGGWGLLWDDDDGALMQQCYNLWGGLAVTFPVTFESSYAEASWALRYRSTVSWDWSLSFLAPQGFSCLPTRKVKWNYTNDKSYSYLILETIVHQKNMFYISLFMYHTSLSFYRHQSSKIALNWVFDSISSFTKFRAVQA